MLEREIKLIGCHLCNYINNPRFVHSRRISFRVTICANYMNTRAAAVAKTAPTVWPTFAAAHPQTLHVFTIAPCPCHYRKNHGNSLGGVFEHIAPHDMGFHRKYECIIRYEYFRILKDRK